MADRRRTGENPDDDSSTASRSPAPASDPARGSAPVASAAGPRTTASNSASDSERERRLRRARFLAELAEARELRKRVTPRRTRAAELHARVLRTFRY